MHLNIKWNKIVEEIESVRQLEEFENKERKRLETEIARDGGSDKEVRKYEKKKKKDPSPPAVCKKDV